MRSEALSPQAALARRKILAALLSAIMWSGSVGSAACADGPQLENPNTIGDRYVRSVHRPRPMALRVNARALGRMGFRYEHGFGVPQSYDAAADYYARGAEGGDAFAQCGLGLSYDRGHGVPQNFVLSYKWLDLAAARASRRERHFYLRLRDAVASKMSLDQVVEGQRLALQWTAEHW